MSEWTTFEGKALIRKDQHFSLKNHLEQALGRYHGELLYNETVEDKGAVRLHLFRLSVSTESGVVGHVTEALRSVPGEVGSLWVEGWLYL